MWTIFTLQLHCASDVSAHCLALISTSFWGFFLRATFFQLNGNFQSCFPLCTKQRALPCHSHDAVICLSFSALCSFDYFILNLLWQRFFSLMAAISRKCNVQFRTIRVALRPQVEMWLSSIRVVACIALVAGTHSQFHVRSVNMKQLPSTMPVNSAAFGHKAVAVWSRKLFPVWWLVFTQGVTWSFMI